MEKIWMSVCVVGLLVWGGGCARDVDRSAAAPGSMITLSRVSVEDGLMVSERVVAERYRIESVDTVRNTIVTLPMEYVIPENVTSMQDVLAPREQMYRKIATVRVLPATADVVHIVARVDVQRRDTTSAQAFDYLRRAEDRPGYIPPPEPTLREDERSQVWTNVHRDYAEEQRLLEEIRSVFRPTPVPAE